MQHLERYLEWREFELFVTPHDLRHVVIPSVRDTKDEPVLASAILADVDILITGDKDFSTVQTDHPAVLTPAAFLKLSKQA